MVAHAEKHAVLEQSSAIEGRDGGHSVRVFGRSVWTYGDTVLRVPDDHGLNWHHNSVSWTMDDDAANGITGFVEPAETSGAPRHFMPPTAEELAFNLAHQPDANGECEAQPCGARWAVWPGAPVWDDARQVALVPYGLIYAEPGDFSFRAVGHGFAQWRELAEVPERVRVQNPSSAGAEHPELLFGEGEPNFNNAPQIVDGELFAFATDGADGHVVRLAKVPTESVHDRSAWRFWSGKRWSANIDDAAELFDGAPIMSVSHNDFLDAWVAIYSEPFSDDIVVRSAPELTGPWSDPALVYTTSESRAPYDAVHHPEFEQEGGRVQFVTYSRPTTGWFGAEFQIVRFVFAAPGD